MIRTFLACTLLGLVLSNNVQAAWHQFSSTAMTTTLSLEFWYEDARQAQAIANQVFAIFDQVDIGMSHYRDDSELSRVNSAAGKMALPVSSSLYKVLQQALVISEMSAGAFDISFGSVGYLYDYRRGLSPDNAQLNAEGNLERLVNYRNIILNADQQSVFLSEPGMRLDLGGIAKGYAVDLGIEQLKSAGIKHASLSAGGDMRLLGDKRGKPWLVGVKDPRAEQQHAVVLPLSDVAISTSGDYERYFIDEQGERIHHILSPSSGRPVKGIQSVTIIGNHAIETDGLSTAVFVLGVEAGLKMIADLEGIDVIIIDAQRKMHYSAGLLPPG